MFSSSSPGGTSPVKAQLLVAAVLSMAASAACAGETSPDDTDGTPKANTLARGGELYAANCQVRHGDQDGRGGTGGTPSHNHEGHTWHHADAQLKEWVLKGKPPGGMPAFEHQLAEAEAILAFIKTWWTEVQRESQEDISRRYQEALNRQQRGLSGRSTGRP